MVAAAVAVGFALAAYLAANGLELLAVQFINPNLTDIVELSDLLLASAVGGTLFLWLHLKATRSELHRLERAQIVMNTQLATAAQIQRRLLPAQPSTVEGIKCAVRFEPAWEIGGDFYDFIPLGRDRMLITVGDISGKGIPAAMLLAFARTVLRTGATRTTDPAQLLALLSNALYEDNGGTPVCDVHRCPGGCAARHRDLCQRRASPWDHRWFERSCAGYGRPSGRHVRSRRLHLRHANAQPRRPDDSHDRWHQ